MKKKFEIPKPLSKDDCIGMIAPAGKIKPRNLEAGLNILFKLGYNNIYLREIFHNTYFLSGSDLERIKEFKDIISIPGLKAVFCIRGGYGSSRIINSISLNRLIKDRIIFCGYSDISIFHTKIFNQGGLISFYGPMPGIDFNVKKIFGIRKVMKLFRDLGQHDLVYKTRIKRKLKRNISGTSFASCLSILQTVIGTSLQPDLRGTILFLEDVDEDAYKIDRMLMHLIQAGILKGVKAVFLAVKGSGSDSDSMKDVFLNFEQKSGLPVFTGFHFGHRNPFNIIPIGADCKIEENRGSFKIKFNLTGNIKKNG